MSYRPKKKKGSPTHSPSSSSSSPLFTLASLVPSLVLPPLGVHLVLLSLPPLFGHSPSNTYTHFEVLLASIPFLILLPRSGPRTKAVAQVVLALSWISARWWIRQIGWKSNDLGVVAGPLVAWAGVGIVGVLVVRDAVRDLLQLARPASTTSKDPLKLKIALAFITTNVFFLVQSAWENILPSETISATLFPLLKAMSLIFYTSTILTLYLRSPSQQPNSPSPHFPSSLLLLALLPVLFSLQSTPSSPSAHLYQAHSKTGLIIVGETTISSGLAYRYLRADHSLLGGRWVVDASSAEWLKSEGMDGIVHGGQDGVGESIFSAFVLQEAVRLVERVDGPEEEGEEEEALVIGLGAGISSRSLILHNISTTIVEYDPAVYHAARTLFFLPEPKAVFLEDANAFVQRETRCEEEEVITMKGKFGVVIHDVFTGGAVPGELFTVEFWEGLRILMKPNGVLAINFAGIQKTQAASLVISTLLSVFPACRGFRDALGESQDHDDGALKNMVIFCSAHLPSSKPRASPNLTSAPPHHQPSSITFRSPIEADYLGSFLRKRVFQEFQAHEVDLEEFGKWEGEAKGKGEEGKKELLWRGEGGQRLEILQRGSGVATWKAMRELMGVDIWNSW